jgi:methionyl-tRNA synthetase
VTATGHAVEWVAEDNFKFRLSSFTDRLTSWLTANPDVIQPRARYNEVMGMLREGIDDISVSRLRDRVRWALPVPTTTPDHDRHCIYVWLDALTVYLTATGFPASPSSSSASLPRWPADYQIIGKDIVKFHAIYWPAFLMAASLPLPKRIIAHGHWTVNHTKMSKVFIDLSSTSTGFPCGHFNEMA